MQEIETQGRGALESHEASQSPSPEEAQDRSGFTEDRHPEVQPELVHLVGRG
jgi:hypothetical protein